MKKNNLRIVKLFVSVIILTSILSGCGLFCTRQVTRETALVKLPPSRYPVFSDDMNYDTLEVALSRSLEYLNRLPVDCSFQFGTDSYTTIEMRDSLADFAGFIEKRPSAEALQEFIESNYNVYRAAGLEKSEDVLFTGYYEPFLRGSLSRSERYRYPLYGRPDDLVTINLSDFSDEFAGRKITGRVSGTRFVPYYDRNDIEYNNALDGKSEPIAYVDDHIDLFFLQIQGSGVLFLDNGETMKVHYSDANGRPYRSIGRLLIDQDKIPRSEMSMQAIKAYLKQYPEEAKEILNHNPSYVFFQVEEDGPVGCLNVSLSPGRSIATDRRLFPAGALSFIEASKPLVDGAGRITRWQDFGRFTLNQDTGGAIKGAGRADIFWGNGEYAEIAAGNMQHSGNMYFLIRKKGAS